MTLYFATGRGPAKTEKPWKINAELQRRLRRKRIACTVCFCRQRPEEQNNSEGKTLCGEALNC